MEVYIDQMDKALIKSFLSPHINHIMSSKKSGKCTFKIGDRIQVIAGDLANELGYVRFIGKVQGKNTVFVGCELDEPRGKHDGEVKSVRYFKTAERHGYMAPFAKFQHFEANKIALNWDKKVEIITTHWFRTEYKPDDDTTFTDDGLQWIIQYGTLLRFQQIYGIGNNEYGELGFSDIKERLKFTKIKVKDIERAYASDGCFFMVRGDEQNNHILAAGNNNWCQLGLGQGNHRTILKLSKIKKFKNILFVSKGLNATHTLFVMKDGAVYGCGNNTMNQLGIPNNGNVVQEKPKQMPLKKTPFLKDKILDIKCGLMHTLFLTTSGSVYGIGGNEDGQIGLGKKNVNQEIDKITLIKGINGAVKAIECGMNASFAVTEEGVVFCWGKNSDSMLGLKKKMEKRHIAYKPTEIGYFTKNKIKIEDINCGAKHVLVMDDANNVYAWGSNQLGQCGIGKVKPEFLDVPRRIKLDKGIKIVAWRMGSFHTFVRSNTNQWYAFGSNAFRQCIIRGDEYDEKVPVPTLIDQSFLPKKCKDGQIEIVCGRETTLVLF
eukprot:31916_1